MKEAPGLRPHLGESRTFLPLPVALSLPNNEESKRFLCERPHLSPSIACRTQVEISLGHSNLTQRWGWGAFRRVPTGQGT